LVSSSKLVFDFDALLGLKHLSDDISHFGHENPLTALRPNLVGIDPDDAFSSVPYEKGFNLLCTLQEIVGEENMNKWLKLYIAKFQYQSITAEQMKVFFLAHFALDHGIDQSRLASFDWENWFNKPGMPPSTVKFDTTLADKARALAASLLATPHHTPSSGDFSSFTPGQVMMVIDQLLVLSAPPNSPISHSVLEEMDKAYQLTKSKNSEFRFRWYTLCLRAGYEAIVPHVVSFLTEQGRMKFVRPLYRDLFHTSFGKQIAVSTFGKHKSQYHSIAARLIAKDILQE